MSDDPTTDDLTAGERETAQQQAKRRRRLAEIFGDVIPEQTSDDAGEDAGAGRRTDEQAQEDWLKSQVPPHHG
jgi:hypothetical protein